MNFSLHLAILKLLAFQYVVVKMVGVEQCFRTCRSIKNGGLLNMKFSAPKTTNLLHTLPGKPIYFTVQRSVRMSSLKSAEAV